MRGQDQSEHASGHVTAVLPSDWLQEARVGEHHAEGDPPHLAPAVRGAAGELWLVEPGHVTQCPPLIGRAGAGPADGVLQELRAAPRRARGHVAGGASAGARQRRGRGGQRLHQAAARLQAQAGRRLRLLVPGLYLSLHRVVNDIS